MKICEIFPVVKWKYRPTLKVMAAGALEVSFLCIEQHSVIPGGH
jgi:hypothetical protein